MPLWMLLVARCGSGASGGADFADSLAAALGAAGVRVEESESGANDEGASKPAAPEGEASNTKDEDDGQCRRVTSALCPNVPWFPGCALSDEGDAGSNRLCRFMLSHLVRLEGGLGTFSGPESCVNRAP